MDAIVEASRAYSNYFLALLLTLPRIYAFLNASQLLNPGAVPALPRTAAILSLALIAVPINLEYATTFDRSASMLLFYFAKEYAVGFLAGYLIGWMFWVVQGTGGLIDSQRGAAIASSIDPLQGEESSSLGNLLSQAFLTYIFTTGAFLIVLGVLYKSYALWPAAKAVPLISDIFPSMALGLFDNAMRLTFVIAAPILAIMFLAEFALAVISRFAPQVQVFVLAMPIKSILAIFVLIFYIPTLLSFAERQFVGSERYVGQLYELLRLGDKIELPKFTTPSPAPSAPPQGGRK
jgi:type III secretion protein T